MPANAGGCTVLTSTGDINNPGHLPSWAVLHGRRSRVTPRQRRGAIELLKRVPQVRILPEGTRKRPRTITVRGLLSAAIDGSHRRRGRRSRVPAERGVRGKRGWCGIRPQ
ncbi:hypothetical protein GCM10010254_50730 [Streptomyces chromofuscus]|nr:hypothetical protein GCM10010254_50730 [Streptomyces chromofuscus]